MPIKGLTTQTPRPTRLGVLRKGSEKTDPKRPGRDLDHFRFDPDAADDTDLVDAFNAAYPDGNDIEVYLPFATADDNFEAWQEEWTASQLVHRCDGETIYDRNRAGDLVPTGKPCTGGCKQVGRLTVLIPALVTGANRFGFVTVLTTSIYDIAELSQTLAYYQSLSPQGDLRGIPFLLRRRPREISIPMGDNRRRVTKHLIYIEPAQQWVAKQLSHAEQNALADRPIAALPLLENEVIDVETGEIIEGTMSEPWREPLTDQLKALRDSLKEQGGAPRALTLADVQSMDRHALEAEIAATEQAIQQRQTSQGDGFDNAPELRDLEPHPIGADALEVVA